MLSSFCWFVFVAVVAAACAEVGMLHGDTLEHQDLVPADVRPQASAAHLSRRWRCRSTVVVAGNHMSFRHVLHLQWVVQGPVVFHQSTLAP